MDILVIGTSEFTLRTAQAVLTSGQRLIAIISMPAHALPLNPADIKGFAGQNGIPYYEFEDLNAPEAMVFLRKLSPDYILSSWPKLLKKEVLDAPKRFVIGSHPTDLPYNRGRHPLHWMIIQGISGTSLCFYRMDEGVDSGNILYKISIEIGKDADIVDLNGQVNKAAYQGTMELLKMLASQPRFEGSQQDQSVSNYWRKRTVHDVILDLRLPAEQIVRIVRSYTLPYPCAKLVFKQHIIRIVEAVINSGAYSREELLRQEPGKVFGASGRVIKVKAGDELVDLTSIEPLPEELVKSKYIHPSTKYFCEWPQLGVQLSKE